MNTRFSRCLGAALLLAWMSGPVSALEIAGTHVDEHVRAGNTELALNGAGLRTRLFFKVYVVALYVPQKSSDAAALLASNAPRRVVLKMLRDVDGDTLLGALKEGLHNNQSDAQLKAMQASLSQLEKIFQSVGTAKHGDAIVLDFAADGLAVTVNGGKRGQIADAAFGQALLGVWLGDKPVDADLKKALLGA